MRTSRTSRTGGSAMPDKKKSFDELDEAAQVAAKDAEHDGTVDPMGYGGGGGA